METLTKKFGGLIMNKKYFVSFVIIIFFAISGTAFAEQYIMKISSAGPMSSATLSAPTFFKNAIERQSAGKITVELFDSGQMGSENDVYMKTKMGALQGGITSVFETSRHATPHMLVSMLPFVWTPENFDKFMKTKSFEPFLHSIDKEGLTMLGFTNVGYYGFITVKPIRTLQDVREAGKIRVTEAPMARAIMNSLGVTPSVMAWGEIYQSLQQNVINGVNHAAEFLVAAKLHEPCNYYTNLNHMFPQSCFYINSKWLSNLPDDLQKLVKVNGEAACTAARDLSKLKKDLAFDTMRKKGVEIIELSPDALKEFVVAADKVHKEYEKKIGKEYLKEIYNITGYTAQSAGK